MCNTDDLLGAVRQKLREHRGDWPRIARGANVPYFTLVKIAQGTVANPRIATVQALFSYLCTEQAA